MRKKITSLLLSAAMLLSYAMPVMAEVTDDMAASPEIGLGDTIQLDVGAGETAYCHFTPEITGTYIFYSTGSWDTVASLYSDEGVDFAADDDSGDGENFRLEYELEAGKTYYLGVRYYTAGDLGEISVTLDHNHAWSDFSTNNDGTHTKTCSICNANETADCTYEDTAEGTEIIHTCTQCGYSYREETPVCGNHQPVPVPAAEATCNESGYAAYYKCETCGRIYSDAEGNNPCEYEDLIIEPLGHDWGPYVSNKGTHTRTCTRCEKQETSVCRYTVTVEDSVIKYTCDVCGYSYTKDSGEEQIIASWDFENKPEDWTVIDRDGDSVVWNKDSYYYENAHNGSGHMQSGFNSSAAGDDWLISPKLTLGYELSSRLSVWVKASNDNYTERYGFYIGTSTDPDSMIPLKDGIESTDTDYHNYIFNLDDYAGRDVYIAIRHYSDAMQAYLYLDDVEIFGVTRKECTTHDFTYVPAKAATCTEDGNIAFYHCNVCMRDYLDDAGSEQVSLSDTVISAPGHLFDVAVSNNNGTHTSTCSRCGVKEVFDCSYVKTVEDSAIKHTCSVCGDFYSEPFISYWDFETDDHGWTFVDRDGDWNSWDLDESYGDNNHFLMSQYCYNAPVDNWAISPSFSLEGCGNPEMSVRISSSSRNCEEKFELYAGTTNDPDQMSKLLDSTEAPNVYTQYKVDLSQFAGKPAVYVAIRHCDLQNSSWLRADDVMITGQYKDACTSHDFTYVPAETATCTEDGNVAYYYCNTCMRYYLDEEGSEQIRHRETVISALGHLNEYVSNNDGTHTGTCIRCGEQETSGCTYNDTIENGTVKHTCSLCGYSYTEPTLGKTIAYWDFENGEEGWIFVDKDEDGRNYYVGNGNGRDGGMCLISVYNSTADVDNWAISPAFSLEGSGNPQLSVWIKAISSGYVEKFELYAGTSNDPDQMTKLQESTEAPVDFTNYTADLSQFAGESTVYIAIRHCDVYDTYDLLADDISIIEHCPDLCDTHNFTYVPAKAACTEDGNIAYWHCETCGRDYLDENGTKIVLHSDTIIPAGHHSYGDPVWTWSEDYSSATAKFTCIACGDEQTEEASITVNDFEDRTEYKATVTLQDKEYTDTKTVFKKLFTGHSLSLAGDICVNFYLNITAEQAADTTVDFTWFDKELNDVPVIYDQATGFYKASCPVAAAEMTYQITATVTIAGEVQEETDVYSVKQYADVILSPEYEAAYEGEGPRSYANLKALVLAMLDYGTRAQDKFDRNVNVPANDGTYTYTDDVTTSDITSTMSSMSAGLEDYGLEYAGSAVILLSNTTIRHYYKVVDSEKFAAVKGSITFGGESVTPVKKGSQICFDLKGVAAQDLDTPYVLHIGNNDYQYSVMDYVRAYIYMGEDAKTLDLVKSLYYYNKTADVYAGGENNG